MAYDLWKMIEERVVTYQDREAYEQDLERQARDGWIVGEVLESYTRVGCLGAILMVARGRTRTVQPRIVVTYRRDRVAE